MNGHVMRAPEHYVHGLDNAGVVLVPARIAEWLHRHFELDAARKATRGADPEVDSVLVALRIAALNWRSSVYGTSPRNVPETEPVSAWLSTTQAADALGLTDRAVRSACSDGRLEAQRVDGRWRISREALEHHRASRRQRAA
ncbi:helix-turn-helix domain-containing protein [Geodermatophilus sp. SYSU D01036]